MPVADFTAMYGTGGVPLAFKPKGPYYYARSTAADGSSELTCNRLGVPLLFRSWDRVCDHHSNMIIRRILTRMEGGGN
jgi:hypothetical protein